MTKAYDHYVELFRKLDKRLATTPDGWEAQFELRALIQQINIVLREQQAESRCLSEWYIGEGERK